MQYAATVAFVQLGMMGAFSEATRVPYRAINADIMISASDSNGINDGSNVARRRMYQALAIPGVKKALPVYIGKTFWRQDDGTRIELTAIGLDPNSKGFLGPALNDVEVLKRTNSVLLDRRSRGLKPEQLAMITPDRPLVIEANNELISVTGTISLGGKLRWGSCAGVKSGKR